MVTRDDVARMAGTSSAVVSYVINNGPRRVSPETRAKVERALAETGYRPNGVARALVSRRSRVLGVIVPDTSNAFYGELARAIEEEALRRGFLILLGNSAEDGRREAGYINAFLERQVEGLLIAGSGRPHDSLVSVKDALMRVNVPTVLIDRQLTIDGAHQLMVDHEQGARMATDHLLSVHGHDRVFCLAGPKGLLAVGERIAGWRSALSAARIDARPRWLVHCPFDRREALRVAHEWLSLRSRPRAIFACSDEQAMGVLRAARMLHLTVPDDLAVVSFDGTTEAAYTSPGLTTISQPFAELGYTAVRLLLTASNTQALEVQRFPAVLEIRGSCGCQEVEDIKRLL